MVQMESVEVGNELITGPEAKRPLALSIPLFVSDKRFRALSEEAKLHWQRVLNWLVKAYALVKAACFQMSRKPITATFMSSRLLNLAIKKAYWKIRLTVSGVSCSAHCPQNSWHLAPNE